MTPELLKKYDEAMAGHHWPAAKVVVEYSGNFREFPPNIEVLSALEHQFQVSIPLVELPALASMHRIKTIMLPGYVSSW